MNQKPKMTADGTYVFDADDIEQLDELSMTSMIAAVLDSSPPEPPEAGTRDFKPPACAGDTTINALLEEPPQAVDALMPARPSAPAPAVPAETEGDLIPAALLFPELNEKGRG